MGKNHIQHKYLISGVLNHLEHGMNILPINSKQVMVEKNQILLMKELEKNDFEPIPIQMGW